MKISASDIAKLGIPSLPTDRQGIEYHAKKNNWRHCFEQIGRGRPKKLYEIASLPAEIRAAIMKRQSDELAEKMPKTLPQVRPGTAMSAQALAEAAKLLNEKQRSVADARCAVVAAVLGIKYQYGCSAKAAVAQFLGLLAEGKLDAVTLGNLEKANDRSRSAKVGERTLDGWISAYLKAEDATERLVALAPKTTKAVKPIESYGWLPMFMQFHNIPSAPKLAHSYRRFVQWAEAENMPVNDVPNLSMVRRVWDKLPLIMQERGRKTGAAYKSLLPYVKRDWGALKPNDVWIGDGHSFKAKVAHPVHGRPFKPEVTVIIDGCTRFVVGFSVSLAESCVAVSDALRIGVKHYGLPIIYYSDNGGGQTGKTIDHEITGITSRLGIRHETGIAGNPQGRGIIERWWKDNLIEMARQYETFAGAGMDSSTKNLMYRKMESAFNALEKGKDLTEEQQKYLKKLPSWSRFIADVVKCIDEYNNRPHGERLKNEEYFIGENNLDKIRRHGELKSHAEKLVALLAQAEKESRGIVLNGSNLAEVKTFNEAFIAVAKSADETFGGPFLEDKAGLYQCTNAANAAYDYFTARQNQNAMVANYKQNYDNAMAACKHEYPFVQGADIEDTGVSAMDMSLTA
ncbi:DDE-type integrase/transposase/recombinase, partial [Neisseria subflava]|uniref:DDE-type integrase/transposase/recombinase n=1 Tax=Neisseria subflava TaxID=28449 RepID=UPI001EF9DBEC